MEWIFQGNPDGRELIDIPRNIRSSFRPLIGPAVYRIVGIKVADMDNKVILVSQVFYRSLIVVNVGDNAKRLPRRKLLCFIPKRFEDCDLEAFILQPLGNCLIDRRTMFWNPVIEGTILMLRDKKNPFSFFRG